MMWLSIYTSLDLSDFAMEAGGDVQYVKCRAIINWLSRQEVNCCKEIPLFLTINLNLSKIIPEISPRRTFQILELAVNLSEHGAPYEDFAAPFYKEDNAKFSKRITGGWPMPFMVLNTTS